MDPLSGALGGIGVNPPADVSAAWCPAARYVVTSASVSMLTSDADVMSRLTASR